MTGLLIAFVLASVLAAPLAPSQCATTAPAKMFQASLNEGGGGETTDATCRADCGPLNPSVSCTYASTCTAVDSDVTCPSQPGYVICDNIITYCTPCCTDGHIRNVTTGPTCSCEEPGKTPKDHYKCIGGLWEYQFSFCGAPFCPIYP